LNNLAEEAIENGTNEQEIEDDDSQNIKIEGLINFSFTNCPDEELELKGQFDNFI